MSEPAPRKDTFALAVEGLAAGLFPSLSPAERIERARQCLGLETCGEWIDGRMVYVERPGQD